LETKTTDFFLIIGKQLVYGFPQNEVSGVMLPHMLGLVCKPVAADFCSSCDHRGLGKESSNSISSSVAALGMIFFVMVEQQTNSKFCCRLRKTGTETHKMLETVY
jgi:hypothetical protein